MILTLLKANVSYTIRIYTGVEDSPTSGKEATIQTGITNFGGYYRVDLNDKDNKIELEVSPQISLINGYEMLVSYMGVYLPGTSYEIIVRLNDSKGEEKVYRMEFTTVK
ncbi:MAG: hypothetical protein GX219_04225 [Tissierellia bacterium]|nr:hypothetical protein [Tissierellia bacterium]